MEGNREGMNAGEALRPDLWRKLPDVLIDIIITKVLIDLPFSKLQSFCRFCKRWRDFLLSSTHYLAYVHMGELKVFNSRRGLWETISLQFCQEQVGGLRLHNLQLVSSCGGLLCLSSDVHGEYIVCNPLTHCCKKLGRRRVWRPTESVPRDGLGTRVIAQSTWHAEKTLGSMYQNPRFPQEVLVYYSDIGGNFQLMLRNGLRYQRRAIFHEYRRASWQRIAEVEDGFCFFINQHFMQCPVLMPLGFHRATPDPGGFNVLVYDLKRKRCRWITTPQIPQRTKRSSRKELVVGTVVRNQLKFLEIGDTDDVVAFPPPLRAVFELLMQKISKDLRATILDTSKFFKMVCVEQDDHIVYHVAMFASSRIIRSFDVIAVWRHNRVDKSDIISEWREEWRSHVGQWPLSSCFHVFKPSLECASCGTRHA